MEFILILILSIKMELSKQCEFCNTFVRNTIFWHILNNVCVIQYFDSTVRKSVAVTSYFRMKCIAKYALIQQLYK